MTFGKLYALSLGILSMLMIVLPKMAPIGFMLIILCVIAGVIKKKLEFKFNIVLLSFAALYILYTSYTFFSRHPELSNHYIESKLTFIILPVVFSFRLKEKLEYKWIIWSFLSAMGVLIVMNYIGAFQCLSGGTELICFFSSSFSPLHHPSYTSVFIIFAQLILLLGQVHGVKYFNPKWTVLTQFVLFISTFFCLSLAGLLFSMLVTAICVLVWIKERWNKKVAGIVAVFIPLLLVILINVVPQLEGEWGSASKSVKSYFNDPQEFVEQSEYPMSGSTVRLIMWTVASKRFAQYPNGVGTGNVDEVLAHELRMAGQYELAKHDYNPHNQYLQTGLEIGWLGIAIIILILVFAGRIAWKNRSYLLLLILANLAFNMLFESMLQRQSGIMFFTFWICLLAVYPNFFVFQKSKLIE